MPTLGGATEWLNPSHSAPPDKEASAHDSGNPRSTRDNDFVKVAANDEAEAELLQGLLRTADVGSVVRGAPGFDVPEFLAAGPREVLVAASDVPVARDVLGEVDPGEPRPPSRSGADRPSRVLAGVLIAVALVALVVCLATDVLP
jgi:Putative prokaryotic signal transducing protein